MAQISAPKKDLICGKFIKVGEILQSSFLFAHRELHI